MQQINNNVVYREEPSEIVKTIGQIIYNYNITPMTATNPETGETSTVYVVGMQIVVTDETALSNLDEGAKDQDSMFLEMITTGTVSDTSKERLCARQIHEGKMEYPAGIPEGISVKGVYDAYTDHYHFKPDLVPPNEE